MMTITCQQSVHMDLPETAELQALVATVQAGSISGAARELSVPRATVSRRLARLEERVSARLLRRTTRRLRLTDAGEELYAHARAIVGAVEQATRTVSLQDDTPRGLLRVSVPPLEAGGLRDSLLDFALRYPEVQLEVQATTRHVDLVAGNIDVGWRAGPTLDPALIARRLASSELWAVATPAYLERSGRLTKVEELVEHACLVGFERGERPATRWPLLDGGRARVRVRLASNDLGLLLGAVQADQGVALLPAGAVRSDVEGGRLERVLPGLVGARTDISLVFLERRLMKPALRAFLEHAVAWWKDHPPEGFGRR